MAAFEVVAGFQI